MDLNTLLQDASFDLEVPPGAVEEVDRRARRRLRRRRAVMAMPVVLAAAVSLLKLPPEDDGASLQISDPTPTDAPSQVEGRTRKGFTALVEMGRRVDYAVELQIQDCMSAMGFDYVATERAPGRLGLPHRLDPQVAAKRGYGVNEANANPHGGASPEYLRLSTPERARYGEALFGSDGASGKSTVPELAGIEFGLSGCSGESRLELWGSEDAVGISSFLVNSANIVPGAGPDPALWAVCMTQAGYPSLIDPDASQQQAATKSRSGEIAQAGADARCQESSGYGDALDNLVSDRLEKYFRSHETFMEYLQRTTAAASSRAETVINDHDK